MWSIKKSDNNSRFRAYYIYRNSSCKVKALPLILSIVAVLCFNAGATAQSSSDTATCDKPVIQADDPVMVALDRLVSMEYFKAVPAFSLDSIKPDETPEEVYIERLRVLDANSPMALVHNEKVQAYINMYFNKKPQLTAKVIGLSAHYYPMIDQKLDKHGLPIELHHLAVVESALNPAARSRAGAVGLWQFMYGTGKIYDLRIDSYVDQRRDPLKATEAACEYLGFLYGLYDDWGLALAAYNCGPGNVNKAIRRSGGKKDFWEVYRWLPRETRGYVPAFIAVNYVMAHYSDHGIVPTEPQFKYNELDSVHVKKQVEFDQLSAFIEMEQEDITYLNPVYRKGIVPGTEGKNHLILPREAIGLFLANEDSIYGFEPPPVVVDGYITKEVTIEHRIRSGEYLGGIAERYGVRVSDLKSWNGIRGTRIYPGKVLLIHTTKKIPAGGDVQAKKEKKPEPKASVTVDKGEYKYHIVQKGDTLWDIAKLYDGVTVDQLKSLNRDINVKRLNPGQKIKIGPQG